MEKSKNEDNGDYDGSTNDDNLDLTIEMNLEASQFNETVDFFWTGIPYMQRSSCTRTNLSFRDEWVIASTSLTSGRHHMLGCLLSSRSLGCSKDPVAADPARAAKIAKETRSNQLPTSNRSRSPKAEISSKPHIC